MKCEHKNKIQFKIYEKPLSRCVDCGLIFVDEEFGKTDKFKLYEDYYRNETAVRFNFFVEFFVKCFRFFRAFKIFTAVPHAKSILDIGCGRGWMLYFLKKYYRYNTVMGTQFSKKAQDFAKNVLKLPVLGKDLLDIKLDNQRFDVVTMWHVLEHVEKPEEYVEKVSELLAPKGKFIIEVPNMNSWTAAFTKKYWLGLDLKYHLYFFELQSLKRLLEKYGFSVKMEHTFSLEYSIFISIQSIVSFLTGTDSLVFEWVQNGGFRPGLIFHILLFILLAPFCIIINLILYFSKRGEILFVIAEKLNHHA